MINLKVGCHAVSHRPDAVEVHSNIAQQLELHEKVFQIEINQEQYSSK